MPTKVNKVNQSTSSAAAGRSASARADEVFDLIHTLMHQVRGQQYRVLRDSAHPITHLEGKVLGFFARHPGALAGELAAHSGRDKAQLARLLGTLKEQGLIETRVDAADRRRQAIHLTAAGQAVHDAVQRQLQQVTRRSVQGLSPAEQGQLLALLQRLQANLAAAEAAGSSG